MNHVLRTPADAAPQLPTEGVEARQVSADVLPCSWAQLWGAGTAAQVQRGLGADGGRRGHPRGLGEAGGARGGGRRGGEAGGRPSRAGRRRGDGGAVAGGGGVGGGGGGGGRQVQDSHFPADRGAEGELAAVDGGGGARGDGERRRRGELAAEPRGFVVQGVGRPRALVGGEEELQRPERDQRGERQEIQILNGFLTIKRLFVFGINILINLITIYDHCSSTIKSTANYSDNRVVGLSHFLKKIRQNYLIPAS